MHPLRSTLPWQGFLLAISMVACTACGSAARDREADRRGRLYITSGVTDELLVLDAADGRIHRSISLERRRDEVDEPHGIAISPDGRYLYVNLSHGEPTLWKFELPDARLIGRVSLDTYGAARIGITPDGRRAFIPDYYRSGQGQVSGLAVVNLYDLTVLARPAVCPAPHDAQVDPAGRRVAIACSLSDEVVVLDASTLEMASRFFVDSLPGAAGAPRFKPLNLVWSPSGDTLYIGMFSAGEVRAIDVAGKVLGVVRVGAGPAQLALSRDGKTLVVANRNDASVSLLELPALRERVRVPLGRPHPHGVALDSRDRTAFITYEGDTQGRGGVVAIDLTGGTIQWSVEAGTYTLGIAYSSLTERESL